MNERSRLRQVSVRKERSSRGVRIGTVSEFATKQAENRPNGDVHSGVAQRQSEGLLILRSWVRSPPPEPTKLQQKCWSFVMALRLPNLE